MNEISVKELQTQTDDILTRIAQGEAFSIQRDGVEVARMLPTASEQKRRADEAFERVMEMRKGLRLGDVSIRELIEEGRE